VEEVDPRTRVLAIDGGQSAIRAMSTESDDVVEVEGVSRDASSEDRVVEAVASAWRTLGRPAIDRVMLGLTTAPVDPERAQSMAERVGAAVGAAEVWLCDDAVTSHAGALSCGRGISLTAGTGVACLVIPERGEPTIIGGHGYLLGDEGGGFWIGREGLRSALRASEGRGSPTELVELASQRFGPLGQVPVLLHDDHRPIDTIARFATDVLTAAADDGVAESIVEVAADELYGVICAAVDVAERAEEVTPVPVALGGRLLTVPTLLRTALDVRLRSERRVAARTADASPLVGAMSIGTQPTPGRYASLVHVWRGDAA
jgi:N-acetylglucosamine kinase-like BadF-type ATPase